MNTDQRFASLLTLVAWTLIAASPSEATYPEVPSSKRESWEACAERQRGEAIAQVEGYVDYCEKLLKQKPDKKKTNQLRKAISDHQKHIKLLQQTKPFNPIVRLGGMAVGDIGPIVRARDTWLDRKGNAPAAPEEVFLAVQQVRGEDEMVLGEVYKSARSVSQKLTVVSTEIGTPFILKGKSTQGIVDDAQLKLDGLYEVTGTGKFAGKTVFVVSVVSE